MILNLWVLILSFLIHLRTKDTKTELLLWVFNIAVAR